MADDIPLVEQDVIQKVSLIDHPIHYAFSQWQNFKSHLLFLPGPILLQHCLPVLICLFFALQKRPCNYSISSLRTNIRSTRRIITNIFSCGRLTRRIEHCLHAYEHIYAENICIICERSGILTPALRHYIQKSSRKCKSFVQTERHHRSKKVYFSKLLESFNENVQIDFMWINELSDQPILHIFDISTSYSECVLVPNKEISSVKFVLEGRWFHIHESPRVISADVEFQRSRDFKYNLYYYGTR